MFLSTDKRNRVFKLLARAAISDLALVSRGVEPDTIKAMSDAGYITRVRGTDKLYITKTGWAMTKAIPDLVVVNDAPVELKVHGTYPYDDVGDNYFPCWEEVRELTELEAGQLLGVSNIDWQIVNKGYVLLGYEGAYAVRSHTAVLLEDIAMFSQGVKQYTEAVYQHDGTLSLIRRTGAVQTRRL